MNRRDFVAAAGGASLLPNLGTAAEQTTGASGAGPAPQILELRRYRLRFGPMEARFAEYQKDVLVPALNRWAPSPCWWALTTRRYISCSPIRPPIRC